MLDPCWDIHEGTDISRASFAVGLKAAFEELFCDVVGAICGGGGDGAEPWDSVPGDFVAQAATVLSETIGHGEIVLHRQAGAMATTVLMSSNPLLVVSGDRDRPQMIETDTPENGQESSVSFLEQFFAGYVENSFLMNISAVECVCFGGALLVGSVGLTPTTCCLYTLGASWGPAIAVGELWRLFTPVFLHASFSHLVVNLLFQLRVGFPIERYLGSKTRIGMLYVGSGVFGNLLSAAYDPIKIAVGASTSGLGLLGASLAMLVINWDSYSVARRRNMVCGTLLIAGLACSSHADTFGHLGGFISGICLMTLLSPTRDDATSARDTNKMLVLRGVAMAVLLAGTGRSVWLLHMMPKEVDLVLGCTSLFAPMMT
mmetsp:Transcript_85664/g.239343  ORF Transcript_85664/g.239343 Transcript_85664/m.239343 type:complete len:373 (-) Transcript_85664:67-1185(-)